MLAVLDQDDCRGCVRVFAVEGLILAIVGFALKGRVWLGVIGIVLFVGTAIIGLLRRRRMTSRSA